NFPGGIPTDGRSAGVAMPIGIYSAIYKIPIKHDVAMTGEIGIHGDVKPVGGVFSKIKAAMYAGAKTVFIPEDNMQASFNELDIMIIPVKRVEQVLEMALSKDNETQKTFPGL